jgi:hypothetical protein
LLITAGARSLCYWGVTDACAQKCTHELTHEVQRDFPLLHESSYKESNCDGWVEMRPRERCRDGDGEEEEATDEEGAIGIIFWFIVLGGMDEDGDADAECQDGCSQGLEEDEGENGVLEDSAHALEFGLDGYLLLLGEEVHWLELLEI